MDYTDCVVPDAKSSIDYNFSEENLELSSFTTSLITSSASTSVEILSEPDVGNYQRIAPSLHYASSYESSYLSTFNPNVAGTSLNIPTAHSNQSAAAQHHHPCAITPATELYFNTLPTMESSGVDPQSSEQLNFLSHSSFASTFLQTQRRRRNSSGSESRMRRHSAAPFRTISLAPQIQRQRRRSHDVRDEQVDILERLRVAATRRRSFSAPLQSSGRSRIFNFS